MNNLLPACVISKSGIQMQKYSMHFLFFALKNP